MTKDNALSALGYVEHILEALKRMFDYMDDVDEAEFAKDTLVQDAVLRNLAIVGHASHELAHFHPEFVAEQSDIAWDILHSLDQYMTHHYFNVDLKMLWNRIEQDLPIIGEQIQEIKEIAII